MKRMTPLAAVVVVAILIGLGSCDILDMFFGSEQVGVTVEERIAGFLAALNGDDRTGIHEHFVGARDHQSLADPAVIDGYFPVDYAPYALGAVNPTAGDSTSTVTTTLTHTGTGAEIEDPIKFDLIEEGGDWFINKVYYPYVAGEDPIIQRLTP